MKPWWWNPELQNTGFNASALFAQGGKRGHQIMLLEKPGKTQESAQGDPLIFQSAKCVMWFPNQLTQIHPPALRGQILMKENWICVGGKREQDMQSTD